jgi:hypothetical protein
MYMRFHCLRCHNAQGEFHCSGSKMVDNFWAMSGHMQSWREEIVPQIVPWNSTETPLKHCIFWGVWGNIWGTIWGTGNSRWKKYWNKPVTEGAWTKFGSHPGCFVLFDKCW